MSAAKVRVPIPPVALALPEAAAALSMSPSSFERNVKHEVRLIRRGSLVLVPVRELERWADENAERTLEAGTMAPSTKRPRTADTVGGMAQEEQSP